MIGWFEWVKSHLHWLVFLILEGASLVMLFRFNMFHRSVWTTQTNALAGTLLEWESDMHSYFELKLINEQLTTENLVLQYNNQLLRDELLALKHDTSYVENILLNHLADVKMIPARVINNSIRQKNNLITINKGSADGIKDEMGVVGGTGIVGIIYEVSEHFSLVLPILNSRSSISCRLRGTDFFGSLKWKGGNILDAYIEDIPLHASFKVGDVVETSGFSSVFPAGIFVGRVSEIMDSSDGLSYQLKVRLSIDLSSIRDVNVIDNPVKEELDSLQARVINMDQQ